MPSDDLSSIPDLQDKHRDALVRELKITTFRALAQADRRDIQRAMRNFRPRPTLAQIAQWQDHARSRLSEATTDRSDWHPAASFAVVFAQRQVDDGWEQRTEHGRRAWCTYLTRREAVASKRGRPETDRAPDLSGSGARPPGVSNGT